jgi:SAM-dependent methyltransferase
MQTDTARPTAYTSARTLLLDLERWGGPATDSEREILREVEGPVLDVGCGPGRLVEALRLQHVNVVGIDAAPTAIARARARGRRIVQRSVFDLVPREGTWASVLLFDGNIGIGGDPNRLLVRIRDLMRPDGCVFVELEPPGARVEFGHVEFEVATGMVGTFPWCWVGCDEIGNIATGSGLRVDDCRSVDGRWFAQLRRASDTYDLNFEQ